MGERPFPDKSIKPDDESLKAALGKIFSAYTKILKQTASFKSEWAFYKSSGWILKVYDSKKALLYIVPKFSEFMVSMTIRENERNVFLKDDELSFAHEDLKSSKKYPEGYAMRFSIKTKKEFEDVSLYLQKLISMR